MSKKLVPDDFNVPRHLQGNGWHARLLTIDDVDKDMEAVMANAHRLTSPNEDNKGWPHNLTRRQNLIDLGWHEKEAQNRSSFAYTVFTDDKTTCLGSVYFYPTDKNKHDVKVEMWAREDTSLGNIDRELYEVVRKWVDEEWPYKNPAFVGTEIDRTKWERQIQPCP